MLLRSCRQTLFGNSTAQSAPIKDVWVPLHDATLALGDGRSAGAAWSPAAPNALGSLHDDVVDQVLSALTAEELLALSLVCARLKSLAYSDTHWSRLYAARWDSTPLTEPAARLAGSWRALYASKAGADAAASPWRRPCEWELRAALEAMAEGPAPPRAGAATAEAPAGDADLEEGEVSAGAGPGAGGAPAARELAVCFLVDGSGSVGEDDFESMTSFIATAAASFTERAPESKVCVLQFSNAVRTEFDLAPMGDAAAFKTRVRKMVRMNGGTNIAAALAAAGAALKAGAGAAAARLVVLLTDGRVDGYQSREAKDMAARLADEQPGVSLWALGVGRGVDRQELIKILEGTGQGDGEARYVDLCVRDDVPW